MNKQALEALARAAILKSSALLKPVKQNCLAAYLSSDISEHLPLSVAIGYTVTHDSLGDGKEEAYEAVVNGIEEASYISEKSILNFITTKHKFIGIRALEQLALKLNNASKSTLELFLSVALEQRCEPGLAKNLYRTIATHSCFTQHEKDIQRSMLEQIERYAEQWEFKLPDPWDTEEGFSVQNFRQLREAKSLTREQLAIYISRQYKQTTQFSIENWELGKYKIPLYAIRALLEI